MQNMFILKLLYDPEQFPDNIAGYSWPYREGCVWMKQ